MKRLAVLALALTALAGTLPDPKPIPAEISNDFFWADGQVLRAQAALTTAMQNRDAAVVAMNQFCGADFTPAVDPKDQKRLVCKQR